jgi:hypothetical protein
MRYRILFIVCTFALFCGGTVHATALSGTFIMSGNFSITSSSVSFSSPTDVSDQFALSLGTGSFVGLDGTNDVNSISGAVGTLFPATVFVTFPLTTDPSLNLDMIAAGVDPPTACFLVPASGQVCTPTSGLPHMPNLNNTSDSVSTASWVVSGVTSDGLSTWSAIFTVQVSEPYQTLLTEIAAGGTPTDTYSATVDVTPDVSPTPEPGTLVLFGSGVVLPANLDSQGLVF